MYDVLDDEKCHQAALLLLKSLIICLLFFSFQSLFCLLCI